MKKICISLLTFCILVTLFACSDKMPSSSAGSALSSISSNSSSEESVSSVPSSGTASKAGQTASSAKSASSAASSTPIDDTVAITVPEGFTLPQIGARLEAKNVCKKADFIKAAQTYDFSYYPLVKAIPSSAKRAYKLEGYLYPDTYEMYTNMKPQDVVGKFLRDSEESIQGKYSYSGMTTDQVITLASIIEREADNADDMKKVSSVFHNRLKIGQRLEADSTRDYCTIYLLKPNGPFDDVFKYYYSTYRCAALPAGPICNPGAAALNAAAHPASTDYYYFITAKGKYYYQKTLEEHEAKLKELGMS